MSNTNQKKTEFGSIAEELQYFTWGNTAFG